MSARVQLKKKEVSLVVSLKELAPRKTVGKPPAKPQWNQGPRTTTYTKQRDAKDIYLIITVR
jgi:hypothetical protein